MMNGFVKKIVAVNAAVKQRFRRAESRNKTAPSKSITIQHNGVTKKSRILDRTKNIRELKIECVWEYGPEPVF